MIPDFDNDGKLQHGIHEANLEEFINKFVKGVKRKQLFNGLKKLITDLKSVGCQVIYIDGSYVTSKIQPNDIDVCWDDRYLTQAIYDKIENEFPVILDFGPPRVEQQKTYNCDVFPAYLIESTSGMYFIDFFQTDKYSGEKKGIIKLQIS